MHVAVGGGVFAASKMITIAPAAVCTNASNTTIRVHQCQSDWYLTLQPGQTQPLIWFNPEAKQELMVRPISREMVWNWSGRFTVGEVASHMLRVHARDDCAHYAILPITIMMQVYLLECKFCYWRSYPANINITCRDTPWRAQLEQQVQCSHHI